MHGAVTEQDKIIKVFIKNPCPNYFRHGLLKKYDCCVLDSLIGSFNLYFPVFFYFYDLFHENGIGASYRHRYSVFEQ